jgi:G patch domain-containing protein 1
LTTHALTLEADSIITQLAVPLPFRHHNSIPSQRFSVRSVSDIGHTLSHVRTIDCSITPISSFALVSTRVSLELSDTRRISSQHTAPTTQLQRDQIEASRRAATAATLSRPQEASYGQSASAGLSSRRRVVDDALADDTFAGQTLARCSDQLDAIGFTQAAAAAADGRQQSPPPGYPASETSASTSAAPPPFSSLFASSSADGSAPNPEAVLEPFKLAPTTAGASVVSCDADTDSAAFLPEKSSAPAYAPVAPGPSTEASRTAYQETVAETKRALPRDTKAESSARSSREEEAEPPPAYSEGSSPLHSFTYLMAAAGGASSIITQVQQGGPPINAIGGERQTVGLNI